MKLELAIEIAECDLEWCYMRATRLRVPIGTVIADMVSLGIAIRDELEVAEAAEEAARTYVMTDEPIAPPPHPAPPAPSASSPASPSPLART